MEIDCSCGTDNDDHISTDAVTVADLNESKKSVFVVSEVGLNY